MPALTVKNIPDEIYEKLKASATLHRRSLNGELIHCLEMALLPQPVDIDERLRRIRTLRPTAQIDSDDIRRAITEGRE